VRSNILEIRKIVGMDSCFLAVVKGNGYGAGIEAVVSATRFVVDWYGVDSLDEAKLVRKKCQNPVLILDYSSPNDAIEIVKNGFSVSVYNYDLALALSRAATTDNPAKIHIKVDTGLFRLGLLPKETIELAKKISRLPNVNIEGLYTHYAKLFDKDNKKIFFGQLRSFKHVINVLADNKIKPKFLHTASSLAGILIRETRFNMVRVGIPLYGLWGYEATSKLICDMNVDIKLYPAITWKTTIVNVKKVPAGLGIGYGRLKNVFRDTRIAILGVGFYDGIDRRYSMVGCVLINGKRAKILGSINMNMCSVDVTDIQDVKIGDVAVLIGKSGKDEITAYDIAKQINTSTYEVISQINPLLPRILIS
jgi:alanine racemase